MTRGAVSTTIRRPPAAVFAVISNVELNARWSSASVEGHLLTPGPVGLGTKAREVSRLMGRRIEVVSEVVAFVADRRLAYHTTGGPFPFDGAFEVEPVDDGTRLTATFDIALTGAGRLVAPLTGLIARRQLRADLGRLRVLMESGEL